MKVSFIKPSKCLSNSTWMLHRSSDLLRVFGIEFDWRVFRVRYKCGGKSILMNKETAIDYAKIFSGEIYREQ